MTSRAVTQLCSTVPSALSRWYGRQARDLPWRHTRDPYAIWVSEVMLQQTQVKTVIPYYQRWMERFANVERLAAAEQAAVLRCWEGLGYYARARNFHRAAQQIVKQHGGVVPDTPELFRALPGVGVYTTAAVMSLAFDQALAVVDGNVRRVLSRLVALSSDATARAEALALATLAASLLPRRQAGRHNQAMMELGALVCTPRAPRCNRCPLRASCRAHATGDPMSYPAKRQRPVRPHRHFAVLVATHLGRILLEQRPNDGLLGGLWDLPAVEMYDENPTVQLRSLLQRYGLTGRIEAASDLSSVDHAYSHFEVTLVPYRCQTTAAHSVPAKERSWRWVAPASLHRYARPAATRRILDPLS